MESTVIWRKKDEDSNDRLYCHVRTGAIVCLDDFWYSGFNPEHYDLYEAQFGANDLKALKKLVEAAE